MLAFSTHQHIFNFIRYRWRHDLLLKLRSQREHWKLYPKCIKKSCHTSQIHSILSSPTRIENGIRQGSPLNITLFFMFINANILPNFLSVR